MSDKIRILFVCVENACRSQMAEGFADKYGGDKIEAFSAGSKPSGIVNRTAIEVMRKIGIDISKNISKGFETLPYNKYDYVVTMGCKDVYPEPGRGVCPYFPAKENIDWQIEDPKGKPFEEFKKIRDEIGLKVKELIERVI